MGHRYPQAEARFRGIRAEDGPMSKSDITEFRCWHVDTALGAKEAGFDLVYAYAGQLTRSQAQPSSDFLSRSNHCS